MTSLSLAVAILLTALMAIGVFIYYRFTMCESENLSDNPKSDFEWDENKERE